MVETINRAHHSRAMATTSTVYKEFSSRGIVNDFQKLSDLFSFRVLPIAHGNVNVAHSQ